MAEAFCPYCNNSGERLDGSPCDCEASKMKDVELVEVTNITIPESYRQVRFNTSLIPIDLGDYYVVALKNLYDDITTLRHSNKNIYLSSPANHAKKVLAYSCITHLFKKNMPVFPIFDVLELKRIMQDLDNGKKSSYLEGITVEPTNIYKAKYLFAVVPVEVTWASLEAMCMLVDRRMRRGNCTIFLSELSWSRLVSNDKSGLLTSRSGDGSFTTIKDMSFWRGTQDGK